MRRGLIVCLLPLLLAGCSWMDALNPFSGGKTKNLPAPLVDFQAERTVSVAWSLGVGSSSKYVFTPAITSDSVYAASANGNLVRVDIDTGHEIWKVDTDVDLTAGVGTDGNTIAVAGENGVLLAYDYDGKLKWKQQLSSEALASPVVGGNVVIVRTNDNHIAGYDAETGEQRWMVTKRLPPLVLRTVSGIAIAGPTAVVSLPGGRMLSLMQANGGTNWEVVVGDPKGTTDLERIADTAGTPAVLGRLVCAVTYQGRLACYDVVNGAGIWAREFSSDVGVSVDKQFVYAADETGSVYAFVNLRGQNVWRNEKLAYRSLSTPVSFDNLVAVGDFEGYIHFLSQEDGGFMARVDTDGSSIKATPIVVGDKLIVQTMGGRLLALTVN